MKVHSLLILIFILLGCSEKREIKITGEYITNDYWHLGISSFFTIERQKVKKDSVLNVFEAGFNFNQNNHWNVVNKLESDTAFVFDYSTKTGKKIADDTVYFSKKNIGDWYKVDKPLGKMQGKFESIGNLEKNTWYKFTDLRESFYHIYIFIDSTGQAYRFDQNLANF